MTTKFNLNPLINYFSDKDPTIASRLASLAFSDSELSNAQLKRIAQALVQIADEVDNTDPALAEEADDLLATITAQMMAPAGDPPSRPVMPPLIIDEEETEEDSSDEGSAEDELSLDDTLFEEPSPEYDEVPLHDFKNRIDGLTLRLTDRSRKERWSSAHELAEKGLKYLQKGRELMEKAHKHLDEGGDTIRFKTDFKW